DVPDGGGAVFSHSKLVVTQPEEGEYKAFSAQCTHGGCTVQEVEDEVIRCLWHGREFDYVTGEPLVGPAQEPLDPFTVTIDGTDIILICTTRARGRRCENRWRRVGRGKRSDFFGVSSACGAIDVVGGGGRGGPTERRTGELGRLAAL